MKVKGFMQIDALMALFITLTLTLLTFSFANVRYHFTQVVEMKTALIHEQISDGLQNIDHCVVTYEPTETEIPEIEEME